MSSKKYLDINVYKATQHRLKYIFKEFDNVLVAFSGGKDSGVLLNLAYEYANRNNYLDKLGMYFFDHEAQYTYTIKYIKEMFDEFKDIKRYWICLPNLRRSATSMKNGYWIPWEKSKKDVWVRDMPTEDYVINEDNVPWNYTQGFEHHKIQDDFIKWFSNENGKTGFLVGIRADESYDRFRAIKSSKKVNSYDSKNYLVSKDEVAVNAYPIYDWSVEDIWLCNAKKGFKYNKLYDLYYQAGMKISEMRVASPFIPEGIAALRYYQIIEPKMWDKMLKRVTGVNFAGIYGKTAAMGNKEISLPDGMTWKSYFTFLLSTLPEKTKNNYKNFFKTSIEFADKSKKFIQDKTYKQMCVIIMKNGYTAKHISFTTPQKQEEKRKKALEKYSKIL